MLRRTVVGAMAVVLLLSGCAIGPLSPSSGGSPGFLPSPTPPAGSAAVTSAPSSGFATPSLAPSPTDPPSATPLPPPTATPTPTVAPTRRPTATPPPTARPTAEPTRTARPTPRPTVQPQPTATPDRPSVVVRHGPRTGARVALTFDMGGRVGDARAIVEWLIDNDVAATIFMSGAMADSQVTDAGRAVLGLVDAHPEQLRLGNHSYHHPDFRDLDADEMLEELRSTEAAIRRVVPLDPRPWFRPPFGGYDDETLATVARAGYPSTVLWDVDTIDWRPIVNDPPGPTADQIVSKVLDRVGNGSIVLMHLGGYETYKALPAVVAGLRDRGYDLVTLDAMFAG
jgi:peptidoglycan/xylan/chitin deacetylase (PgdA/CDA1 family)